MGGGMGGGMGAGMGGGGGGGGSGGNGCETKIFLGGIGGSTKEDDVRDYFLQTFEVVMGLCIYTEKNNTLTISHTHTHTLTCAECGSCGN